jgi:flagellar biosynthesis/type III secretory pathway M-ring protein FliF/YscJ
MPAFAPSLAALRTALASCPLRAVVAASALAVVAAAAAVVVVAAEPVPAPPERAASGLPQQIELQAALERDVNAKVARVLEPLLGPDGFVVKTTAEVDFTRVLRREKSYDPDSAVVLSEERTRERKTAATERQDQRTSYEYSFREESFEPPVGQLKRLSVAVLVDQRWSGGGESAEVATSALPRNDEEIASIEDLVKGAIGFDAQRGDRVTVEQAAFRREPAAAPAGPWSIRSWPPQVAWPALGALALLAGILLARALWGGKRGAGAAAGASGDQPLAAAGADAMSGAPAGSVAGTAAGRPSPVEALRQRLAAAAVEQPEGMAQTLRVWLHEARDGRQP